MVYGRISRKLRQVVGDHAGGGGKIRETLSEIRGHAYRLRKPLDDWDFEIEIRPQFSL